MAISQEIITSPSILFCFPRGNDSLFSTVSPFIHTYTDWRLLYFLYSLYNELKDYYALADDYSVLYILRTRNKPWLQTVFILESCDR